MKNRASFIILNIITLLLFCNNLYGQTQQNQFGYVNVADAMLLHPTMRYFDPVSKRFKLEALKGVNPEKRMEENKTNFKAELNKLEENVKELEAQRNELNNNYYAELKKIMISEEKLKSMSVQEKNKYNEKRTKIDNKHNNEADELRKKIFYAKQKIESFKNNSLYTGLSTQGETSQLFSLMLDDVYDAMGAVAKHYNVSFVFNSSAEICFIEGRMTASNPMGDFLDNFEQTVQDRDGKKIMGAAFSSWLGEKNSTFLNCNDRRMTSFVMMGGLNMTPAVIDYIYQKHKVGKEQRDFIIEYFSKIVNNEEN
jgi:hypothetical protein